MMALRPGMYVLTEEQFNSYREAYEKQKPKKPMDCNGERMCECGNIVKSYQKYCYECGHAIDWSEVE